MDIIIGSLIVTAVVVLAVAVDRVLHFLGRGD